MILVGNDSVSSPGPLTLSLLVSFTASSKTISGLLEFDSKTEAVEVLTVLNHYQIRIPSKSVSETTSLNNGLIFQFVRLNLCSSDLFVHRVALSNTMNKIQICLI